MEEMEEGGEGGVYQKLLKWMNIRRCIESNPTLSHFYEYRLPHYCFPVLRYLHVYSHLPPHDLLSNFICFSCSPCHFCRHPSQPKIYFSEARGRSSIQSHPLTSMFSYAKPAHYLKLIKIHRMPAPAPPTPTISSRT